MRRIAALVALVLAAGGLLVVLAGADGDGGSYKVRAIFDNASFIIPGEDVKVAGVVVGAIDEVDVTPQKKAAIVLDITHPGFQDFRADARCLVRPQSVIGEQFVECSPTEPRAEGERAAPPLKEIEEGEEGAGQKLLPVQRNSGTVGIDLVNNVLRMPYRQRLALIINELGTGLAGNGEELRQVVRRANPALQQLDEVLKVLARENQALADLARDSDRVLAPLARNKGRVTGFIENAGEVAQATAERRADLERNLQLLPTFLAELRPTMDRLAALADEGTPTFAALGQNAPALNRFIAETGPFSEASRPAFRSLGRAAEVGRPALATTRPLARNLRELAGPLRPAARQLSAVLRSLRDTGGIERLMDFFFYQVSAVNGFDRFGHVLRAGFIRTPTACNLYASTPQPEGLCSANFNFENTYEEADDGDPPAEAEGGEARARAVAAGAEPPAALPALTEPTPRAAPAVPAAPSGGRDDAVRAQQAPAPVDPDSALLTYLFGTGE